MAKAPLASASGREQHPTRHNTPAERSDIRVVELATEVGRALQAFHSSVARCLDLTLGPDQWHLCDGEQLMEWKDVPKDCGVRIERSGPRGQRQYATPEEQLAMQTV